MQKLGITPKELHGGKLYRGKGAESAMNRDTEGVHGVYELMLVDNAIQKQIATSPDAIELRRIALQSGMTTLLQHGAELVKQGITTVEKYSGSRAA